MNCDKYLDLMSAALDGECTAEERRELDGHLAVCPECAELFRILSANANAARELDCEVPANLKDRIMSNLPEQEKAVKQGKVIRWKRWLPVAAAACLVLVISLIPGGLGGAAMDNAAPEAAPGGAPVPSSAVEKPDSRDGTAYGIADDYEHCVNGDAVPSEAPAEPEAYNPDQHLIYNPQAIRVHYGATPERGAVVIGSVDTLEKYLSGFESLMWDGEGSTIPIAELEVLRETYTKDFFKHHQLLCVVVVSGSGSNRYEFHSLTQSTVTIRETVPEVGTCDMAAWLLVAEIDTAFYDGDTPEVDFIR